MLGGFISGQNIPEGSKDGGRRFLCLLDPTLMILERIWVLNSYQKLEQDTGKRPAKIGTGAFSHSFIG